MTLTRAGLSSAASFRIRTFWILLWGLSILGFLIIALGFGLTAFTYAEQRAWDMENPVEATTDDGGVSWHGEGNAVVRMTEEEFGDRPFEVTVSEAYSVTLHVTDEGETFGDDYFYPSYVGSAFEDYPAVLLPLGRDVELWISANEPWTIHLSPLDTQPVEDRLSGTGEAYVSYRGDATSARIEMGGDGILGVRVLTPLRVGVRESEIDEFSERVSWDPAEFVVFEITTSDPNAKWLINIDLLAEDSTVDSTELPSSTQSPMPTPTSSVAAPAAAVVNPSLRPFLPPSTN